MDAVSRVAPDPKGKLNISMWPGGGGGEGGGISIRV